jgi:hypothetical protein
MRMTPPGEKQSYRKEIGIILITFLFSRILSAIFGIHLQYDALFKYWQYLDTETLHHHLLLGLWYDHAQPPFFNFLLGLVLKIAGIHAPLAFAALLKLISLTSCLLLFAILKRQVLHPYLPLLITLIYLLSPALIIFESELFYTTFISMLLLISAFFLLRLTNSTTSGHTTGKWKYTAGICLPLVLMCLTRSMYHILWLAGIAVCLLFAFNKSTAFKPLLTGLTLSLLLVSGWYVKNYVIFGQFSTSSWLGMNFARTVFHDNTVTDSSRIEAIEPFLDITYYKPFIKGDAGSSYAGLDDRDLLQPNKNDSFRNLNLIDYIEVSKKYMAASTAYVKQHPKYYLMNVVQSCIMFFAPATRYPFAESEAKKIKAYDLVYSFNLTHFAEGKGQRRIALMASAIPKMLIYFLVFFIVIRSILRQRTISPLNLLILCTFGFVFLTSSLIEHYENMRFRYEIEPLFLILLGQALTHLPKLQKK